MVLGHRIQILLPEAKVPYVRNRLKGGIRSVRIAGRPGIQWNIKFDSPFFHIRSYTPVPDFFDSPFFMNQFTAQIHKPVHHTGRIRCRQAKTVVFTAKPVSLFRTVPVFLQNNRKRGCGKNTAAALFPTVTGSGLQPFSYFFSAKLNRFFFRHTSIDTKHNHPFTDPAVRPSIK